ncbi:hypothetical protein BG28_03510 [Nesterenkonia sp. AN1]|uniref:Uncharacterized protein n=1 Tax=Nesterenkonia aurantiaca TaxID=1436010 RepID=A0A4R7G8M8_9MICC|nr:hypothetical protein [Nesterenkonia]EXF24897.1 hypothetical protein BG28_03510 [Nesterenkonia sp. AN1]TDS87807.1 hypothetical protein EV640_101603 [Nesterenkonia aurantiaca]
MNVLTGLSILIGGVLIIVFRESIYHTGRRMAQSRQDERQLRFINKVSSKFVTFIGIGWLFVGVIFIIEPSR